MTISVIRRLGDAAMREIREIWVNIFDTDDEREFFVAYQSKEFAEENTPDGFKSTKFIEKIETEAICLTENETREVTGKRRTDAQRRALDAMGIAYRVRFDGSAMVLRSDVIKA